MLLSEDAEDRLFKKHKDLCNKLSLDQPTITQAWNSFQAIRNSYNLEGESLHWLGCAVFVACRKTTTPTVGQMVIEGNGVNLTSLLRYCNLSLAQFFNKIKKWVDMANINEGFRQKIESLEGNFAVSCNVFKEYNPIFKKIFKPPTDLEESKHHRNRKQRAVPCNTTKVFEFIWNLFVTLKGEGYLSCSEDLVTSFHLLLACCDLAFQNAFLAERRDLLNPDFDGLPSNWNSIDYEVPKEAPCIIDNISGGNSNMATEAKYMKQYHCKKFITNFFTNGTLQGNKEQTSGLFDPGVFDSNFKNIMKLYEAHLLNKGDFDERIFLAEFRRRTLLKEQEQLNNSSSVMCSPQKQDPTDATVPDSPRNHEFGQIEQHPPSTPLTGREYLGPKVAQTQVTPLSTAMQSVAKLQALLSGRQAGPNDTLLQMFEGCSVNPTEKIADIVQRLGEKFVTAYTQQASNLPEVQADYANKRLQFGATLFYKLIESIFQHEGTISKDISPLLEKEIFYQCIFASSLEIVMFSYNSQRKFPWILQVLDVQPYYFVKVIELIVRSKDQFSREVVKHLGMIEETILESLAWRTGSPLWDDIQRSGQDIPKFEDTALPGNLMYTEMKPVIKVPASPLQSPGPSALDRFQSPIMSSTPVKKQLFPISKTILQNSKATHLMVTDEDGKKRLFSLADAELESSPPAEVTTPSKSKRTGSLAIFFRKFYNLAGVRLEDLCTQLGITDIEFKRKIFTVFEHSIRHATDLIRDRHLDQLLMCAVYVICKVPETKKFTDIMRCYRQQPQAASHVYRSVLMRQYDGNAPEDITDLPERSDLIHFYNFVYVKVMREFLLEFTSTSNNQSTSAILLSPLPAPKSNLVSPKQQLVKNVFVKPYESPNLNSGRIFSYCFSRSPSKDLKEINKAVNNSVSGKRLLIDDDSDAANKRIAKRKVQSLIEDRISQNME